MELDGEINYDYIRAWFLLEAEYVLEDKYDFIIYWMSYLRKPMISYLYKEKTIILIVNPLRTSFDNLDDNQQQNLKEFVEQRYNIEIDVIR